jgi:hypothetical protein
VLLFALVAYVLFLTLHSQIIQEVIKSANQFGWPVEQLVIVSLGVAMVAMIGLRRLVATAK